MRLLATVGLFALFSASLVLGADAKAGEASYNKACKSCHGVGGKHNPNIAKSLKVDMKDLDSADAQALSDADLKKIITDGQGKMKAMKSVSAADADNIVAYLRTLKK
jgi:mono/diheme cytochrome c family protein